jgi:hypothetical protein
VLIAVVDLWRTLNAQDRRDSPVSPGLLARLDHATSQNAVRRLSFRLIRHRSRPFIIILSALASDCADVQKLTRP